MLSMAMISMAMISKAMMLVALLAAAVPLATAQLCPVECTCASNTMDCSHAGLTQPPPGVWQGFDNLRLSNNSITAVYEYSFSGFSSVSSIFLDYNSLVVFDFAPYAVLPRLTSVRAMYNNIHTIKQPPADLRHERLWSLHLDFNNLTSLDPDVLVEVAPDLDLFSVKGNPVVMTPGEPFLNHPKVTYLVFTGVDASSFGPESFRGLPNLQTLFLSGAGVRDLSGAFLSNPRLSFADLSANNISAVRAGSFAGSGVATFLNLGDNPLQQLEVAAVSGALKQGGSLYIHNSPLACTCAYEHLHRWALEAQVKIVASCVGAATCSFPDDRT